MKELNQAKQKIEKKLIDEQTEILKLVMFYEKKIFTKLSKDCMFVIFEFLTLNVVFKLRQLNRFYKSKIDSGKILDKIKFCAKFKFGCK